MKIRKAVFPVAGFGTRFLPATKAMPKELLPFVEKPNPHEAPSNVASIGQYVSTPDIFDTLRGLKKGTGDEIQSADIIEIHAKRGLVDIAQLQGKRFDCGSIDDYFNAIRHIYEKDL